MVATPTRIRQQVRDLVDADTAPLAGRLEAVRTLVGYRVQLDLEWAMLWATLQPCYPDPATFVPSIVAVITAWCDAFTAWIESDDNAAAVERLLEAMDSPQAVRLSVEITPRGTRPTRPMTSWRSSKSGFVLFLPESRPSSTSLVSGFASDFLALFTGSPSAALAAVDGGQTGGAEDLHAWDDLFLSSPHTKPAKGPDMPAKEQEGTREICDVLPEVSALERPEELTRWPPYWMVVKQPQSDRIVVQCSHQGSLLLLEAYLKKWARHSTDFIDRPPVVDIGLRESPFGLGLLYDMLVLEGIRGRVIGPTLVLMLVEGVLGYDPVPGTRSAGTVWEFKRTKPFK